jgi:Toprim domain
VISQAGDLARRLARDAEAVCRHYLSRGCRHGHYWVVGDARNTPGRSLYVRLDGPDYGPGAAGKWTDSATGEHGDLLDLIVLNRDLHRLGEAMDDARSFLAVPRPAAFGRSSTTAVHVIHPRGSAESARRLFRAGRPIGGTMAETYLRARRITAPLDWPALRYHPSVYYRETEDAALETWPAFLAAVTDLDGHITGIQRTWLDPLRPAKAPLTDPRRALGHLLGNGVRLGIPTDTLAAGEGLETMLALKSVLPRLPVIAGLSANHLAALEFAPAWRRLYVARDNDAAGVNAANRLHERGAAAGIEIRDLVPVHADFNLDLCRLGPASLLAHLVSQFVPSDLARFLSADLSRSA